VKIAMMVRGYLPVPRPKDIVYANIDLAVDIAEGLARRGHQVDFYAPMGSELKRARVVDCSLRPLATNLDEFRALLFDTDQLIHGISQLWDNYMADEMFKRALAGEYDLLHFDHPESAMPLARVHRSVQTVYTLHDPINQPHKEGYELYETPNQHFISISNNQRRDAPDLPYLGTIHHGIDTKAFAYNEKPEDYLLYYGRIVPEKGVREAIQVARETQHRLLIIGPTYPDSMLYFEQYVKPQLDDQILYLGYIERDFMPRYIQRAKALLTPVQWEEPFGLTTIESMACGTPVISFNRGAAPEIIEDGKTGYVVNTTAEMIDAVHKISKIKRTYCREYVEKNYSIKQMVDSYEKAFENVIKDNRAAPRLLRKRLSQVPQSIRTATRKRRLQKLIKTSRIPPPKPTKKPQ
jgi:glycosyltransferase involved in cell wall biosynthesis